MSMYQLLSNHLVCFYANVMLSLMAANVPDVLQSEKWYHMSGRVALIAVGHRSLQIGPRLIGILVIICRF